MEKEYQVNNKTIKVVVWTKGKEDGYTYKVNFIYNGKSHFFPYKDTYNYNRCLGCVEDLIDDCTFDVIKNAYDFMQHDKFDDFEKVFNAPKWEYNKCRKVYFKMKEILSKSEIFKLYSMLN